MTNEPSTNEVDKGLPDLKAHYVQVHSSTGQVIQRTFKSDQIRQLSSLHCYVADLSSWIEVLHQRPEISIYQVALHEYQYSLFAVASGLYRQAFMSLRLFLEMLCFGIECSANELKLHKWVRGELDLKWSSIVDENSGVFSRDFTRAFFYELEELSPQYQAIAKELYRECSQFVHANYMTLRGLDTLHYDQDVLLKWLGEADSAKLVASFLLCVRHLKTMSSADKKTLEMAIADTVGHIPHIRATLGGPTEASHV